MTHLTGKERAAYVQAMFDRLAGRYDLMNRLITFGQDLAWRRFVVQQARLQPGQRLLDLATGTGDIAFEARKMVSDLQVVGGDFALRMMFVGQRRAGGDQIGWTGADALRLPSPMRRLMRSRRAISSAT
jgi:demethylmenaquinone methyltransferase / 2-methoxy-6-polyprenyl-1,4-benzoquinol methylase